MSTTCIDVRHPSPERTEVWLNRPEVRNAFNDAMIAQLTQAFAQIARDERVRVVLLAAHGKAFCAGADLKGRKDNIKGPGDMQAHSRRTRECFHAIRECAKPVVVAINGASLGSGLAMVASADIIVASEKATLGLPEVDVGLLGGCGLLRAFFGIGGTSSRRWKWLSIRQ